MLKRLAWLWMAMLVVTGASAYAAEKATSMDRHLAPDQYPTHVVKILRSSNKAQTNSYVPVVFTMRNVNPFDVIRFLKRPIEPEDGLLLHLRQAPRAMAARCSTPFPSIRLRA